MSNNILKLDDGTSEGITLTLADLYAPPTGISGSVVNYLIGYNDASNNTGIANQVGFLAPGQTTTIENNNIPIDRQDNGSIESFYKTSQTFPQLSAYYKDYGLDNLEATTYTAAGQYNNQPLNVYTETDVPIPKWCNYIIAIVIGGGGWVNNGRSEVIGGTDNDYTSGSGGSGGIIAWKSPELIHTTAAPLKYDINIELGRQKQLGNMGFTYNTGQYPGYGGNAWIDIYKTEGGVNIGVGSCQGSGGHQSNWVTGDDDDDTHGTTLVGGAGGVVSSTNGTVLYSTGGYQGGNGVGGKDLDPPGFNNPSNPTHGWDDGTTIANNSLAGKVDSWTNAGRGAYWATGDNVAEQTPGQTSWLDAARIDGGSNGTIRVYFIADIN
jgi:hypothetical protein